MVPSGEASLVEDPSPAAKPPLYPKRTHTPHVDVTRWIVLPREYLTALNHRRPVVYLVLDPPRTLVEEIRPRPRVHLERCASRHQGHYLNLHTN